MDPEEELLGADFVEHLVRRPHNGVSEAVSVFASRLSVQDANNRAVYIGGANCSKKIRL